MTLHLPRRVSANGLHFYGVEQRYLLKWLAILFIISVICFGPVRHCTLQACRHACCGGLTTLGMQIVGVIAASLEYGAYDR